MIDAEKVKSFWQTRSEKLGKLPFESIANLEEKVELLELKLKLEQERIMPLLPLMPDKTILDMGAGVGQWTFRFAPFVNQVVAVEYMDSLAEIGRAEAINRQVNNVTFITNSAETFQTTQQFDIVFISGLFVYLNPDQAQKLMKNLSQFIKPDGLVLVRDGTSVLKEAHHINNRYSTILNEQYSAYYRTRDQYISLFEKSGFTLSQDGQMFDESGVNFNPQRGHSIEVLC